MGKVAHRSAVFNSVYHNLCSFCPPRAQFISDKNGISINSDLQFENGKLRLCVEEFEVLMWWYCSIPDGHPLEPIVGCGASMKLLSFFVFLKQCVVNLKVENTGTEPMYFTYYTPLHWLKNFTLKDEHRVTKTNPLCLKPGKCKYDAVFAQLRDNLRTQ